MGSHIPWFPRWKAVCDKLACEGYDALTPPERIWVSVRSLIDSTENGGLISYYYNTGADTLPDCLAALDSPGAEDVRRQVERVNALFGRQVPPSLAGRNRIIDSWGDDDERIDAVLTEVDDALQPMFESLETKLDSFPRDVRLLP
ncbi:MAG: DUF4375 domain-containing protein [Phycisphaerae bacterium]|nr:DUF4375 domain-containing protein [Phycisphaerae bacterium]